MGRKLKDLTNLEFYDLLVINRADDKILSNGRHMIMWNCICKCKKEVVVESNSLTSGHTKSCGCRKYKTLAERTNYEINNYNLSGDYGIGHTSNTIREFYFDLEDYDLIKRYTWEENYQGYIVSRVDDVMVRLHRLVMNCDDSDYEVDHIKHNLFDNRKSELRICVHQNNTMNHKKQINNKSGIAGVYFDNQTNKWRANIKYKNKTIQLGRYKFLDDAIKIRKESEEKYFGEYSYDNSMNTGGAFNGK